MTHSRRFAEIGSLALVFGVAISLSLASASALAADGCCGGGGSPGGAAAPGAHGGNAADAAAKPVVPAAGGLLIDLGNTKCPVLGGVIDGKTWSEWRGIRVGHCCGGCGAKFLAAPEKVLDAAKIGWRAAVEAVKTVADAKPEDRAKLLDALKSKWTVLRDGSDPAPTLPVTPAAGPLLVDLANAKCPIMGGAVDGETWSEWNGLRIGHCCAGCVAKFAKDPEKALDAAKIEWRAAADAVRGVRDAKPGDRAKAIEALRAKWTVVREPAEPKESPAPAK